MKQPSKRPSRDQRQLKQIIAGLTDGVILIGTDQRILWANEAALAMHGTRRIKDLGATVGGYRRRFRLRYRNNRPVERGKYPIERVAAGENFSDVIVEVTRAGNPEQRDDRDTAGGRDVTLRRHRSRTGAPDARQGRAGGRRRDGPASARRLR